MKVSVLMPTYNRVDMLPGAVESFLNQDYENAKLFILNNGSTDGTAEYLEQFKTHPKIEVITLSHNVIPPRNFNLLLHEYAAGDLVCHLHDDDRLLPTGISDRVNIFKEYPDTEVVYSGWITNGTTYYADPPFKERIVKEEYISFITMMWRLNKVDGTFDTDFRYNHDWLFKVKCLMEHKVRHYMYPTIIQGVHTQQDSVQCRLQGQSQIEADLVKLKVKQKYGI